MVDLSEFKDKELKYFWYIVLYLSLFAVIFFVFYGLKTINDEQCSEFTLSNSASGNVYTLSDGETLSFPVSMPKDKDQNIISSMVCLYPSGSSASYNSLTIDNTIKYVNNASGITCFEDVTRDSNNYLSVTCTDCTPTNNVSFATSKDVAIITHNNIFSGENLRFSFINQEHCKELYKTFVMYYFLILGLFVLIFLGWRVKNWFSKWLFEGVR